MLTRIFCVLLGFLAGIFAARLGREAPPSPATVVTVAPRVVAVPTDSPGEAAPPVIEADAKMPSAAHGLPPVSGLDRLEFLRALADLNREKILQARINAFDSQERLSDEAKQLFAITDGEATRIESIMERTRNAVAEIEIASATVAVEDDGDKVVLDIPSFPEDGGRLFDDLRGGLKEVLGEERGALLVESGHVERLFSEFGMGVREITVERTKNAEGRISFNIQEKAKGSPHENPDGEIQYRSTSTSTTHATNRAGIVRALGPLGKKLLPEDF